MHGGLPVILMILMLPMTGIAPAAEPVASVAHGREITEAVVGPHVLGRTSDTEVPGGVLAPDRLPPYVKRIAEPATYDGFSVAGAHLLIEDVTIRGALDISTPLLVVLRRVTVFAPEELPWLILIRPGAGPLYVLYSDIGGAMRRRGAAAHVGVALALRADGARVHRSRIGAAADGIQVAARDIRVTESLIGNLLSRPGDHNDALQLFPQVDNVEIARNRIENAHPQTSAVTVLGHDVRIVANLLAGGGYTIYGGARNNGKGTGGASGVRVEQNVLSRAYFPNVGRFGPVAYWSSEPGSGNIWRANGDDRGRPVAP